LASSPVGRGEFELPFATWTRAHAQVTAPDRGLALVLLTADHAADGERLEIRQRLAGGIDGRLLGSWHGEASVELATEPYALTQPEGTFLGGVPVSWSARVDAGGGFRFDGLPSEVLLRATVEAAGPVLELPEPILLAPGERRAIEWQVGGGATVEGTALEEDGQPARGLHVWLVAWRDVEALYLDDSHHPTQRQTTDSEGRFRFPDVPAGEWVVGPRPIDRLPTRSLRAQLAAPAAQRFSVAAGEHMVEVVLRVQRGHFLGGVAVDGAGVGVAGIGVNAHGLDGGGASWTSTKDDGSFLLGPLVTGRYSVRARGAGNRDFAGSETVEAEAGTTDVVLHLLAGGSLSGRAVDALMGAEVRARVAYCSLNDGTYSIGNPATEFRLTGLMPGSYDLSARTDDGRAGALRAVEVVSGPETAGLVIPLEPGAHLRVRYDGPAPYATLHVHRDGVHCGLDTLQSGSSLRMVVPPGAVILSLSAPDRSAHSIPYPDLFAEERRLDAAAGEEVEVSFEIGK